MILSLLLACRGDPGPTGPQLLVNPPTVPWARRLGIAAFGGFDLAPTGLRADPGRCNEIESMGMTNLVQASNAGVRIGEGELRPWTDGVHPPKQLDNWLAGRSFAAKAVYGDACSHFGRSVLVAADRDLVARRFVEIGIAVVRAEFEEICLLVDGADEMPHPSSPLPATALATVVVQKDRFRVIDATTTIDVVDLTKWVSGRSDKHVALVPDSEIPVSRLATAWSALELGEAEVMLGVPVDENPLPVTPAPGSVTARRLDAVVHVVCARFPDTSTVQALVPPQAADRQVDLSGLLDTDSHLDHP